MHSFQANVTHLYTYEQNSGVAQDEADVAIAPPRLPDTQNWLAHLHLVCQAWQTKWRSPSALAVWADWLE